MKIDFQKEMMDGFKKQYPEKLESYGKLFEEKHIFNYKDILDVYDDFMETFPFLIKLIIKIEKEEKQNEN